MIDLQLVQRRLTGRPGLPSPMHPEPLIRIAAHVVFNDLVEKCGIGNGIGVMIAGSYQVHRGVELHAVFAQHRVPDGERRNHCAPVCKATRATPLAVQAGTPKKFTNTPCGGVMLVSIRTPTVSLLRMAASKPRANSSLPIISLPWRPR